MPVYLNVPGVTGDVATDPYYGWIELQSASWASGSLKQQNEIVCTKFTDSSSNALYGLSINGSGKDMAIAFVKDGQEYMRLEMKGVLISGFSMSSSKNNDRPMETVTLNYQSIEYKYVKKDETATSVNGTTDDYSYQVCYPDGGYSTLEE
jgi:type VI protein secretion system component Hcp